MYIPTQPLTGFPVHSSPEKIPDIKKKLGNPLSRVFIHRYITAPVPEFFQLRRGRLFEIEYKTSTHAQALFLTGEKERDFDLNVCDRMTVEGTCVS
jgi:hypothetical protein